MTQVQSLGLIDSQKLPSDFQMHTGHTQAHMHANIKKNRIMQTSSSEVGKSRPKFFHLRYLGPDESFLCETVLLIAGIGISSGLFPVDAGSTSPPSPTTNKNVSRNWQMSPGTNEL